MQKFNDLGLPQPLVDLFADRFPTIREWEVSAPNDEGEVFIIYQGLRLDMRNIGEGMAAEYDPSDPNDVPLLRMGFHHQHPDTGELTDLPETSYCTSVDVRAPWVARLEASARIFSETYGQTGPAPKVEEGEDLGDWGLDLDTVCAMASTTSSNDEPAFVDYAIELMRAGSLSEDLQANTKPAAVGGTSRVPRV